MRIPGRAASTRGGAAVIHPQPLSDARSVWVRAGCICDQPLIGDLAWWLRIGTGARPDDMHPRRIDIHAVARCIEPARIDEVHRVVADIGMKVHPARIADRIGLQEPAEVRRIDAGAIMVHAELGHPRLPGILEPARVRAAGDAVFVIAVDVGDRAGAVADRDDRAAFVGMVPMAVRGAASFVPDQGLVDTRAVDVAAGQRVVPVIFDDYRRILVDLSVFSA